MRITRYAATVAAAGLVLAACSSEAGDQVEEVTEGAAPEVAEEVEFPEGSTMAELAEAGSITVGTKFDQPGFGLLNPEGVPEGFDVEIAKLVAAELGIAPEDIEWMETVSANREDAIKQGRVDLVAATYTINDERKEQVAFAGPYYIAGQDIMVAEGNPLGIQGPEDLAGKRVCSVEGSTPAEKIRTDYPEAQLVLFDVYSKCADALRNDQVDAVTTDNVILTGLVAGSPDEFDLVGNPFTEEPYGLGLAKEDTEFREFVNDVLQESFENGEWAEAWERTAGQITGQEAPEPPELDRY